ncbi:unnamed protein product [Adineta steineri]|uniref:Mono(ADP-ribosyl)transferase n=1 Tax=Adineta steineri TaxID=433720 RepID=A0A813MI63_9BILA|nr:unnamed protein product [Adineta steineri]
MGICNGKQESSKQNILKKNQYEYLLSMDNMKKTPIVTLEQAVIPLVPFLPTIQTYVRIVKEKCENPADGLTCDESASIMLYSMGWQPLNECLYVVLNTTLRSINQETLQPWFLYLKLLFTALLQLPSSQLVVYRENNSDLSKQYKINENFTWWDFSLCTILNEDYLQSNKYLNKTEIQTIFIIECNTIKDIRRHTYFQSDNSVLILPGTQFKVLDCLDHNDNNYYLIKLQEIQSSFLLQKQISNIKPRNFLRRFWSCGKKESEKSLSNEKSPILNSNIRSIPLDQILAENNRSWTVNLDEQNITDRDMKFIVKKVINKKRYKRIRLRDNNITSQGALILADGLHNNTTLESLDLRNNYIEDLGVQSLALAVIHSNLKTLNLESNGITYEGAQYLAEMLKYNHTITELYLSKNHLGDKGVKLLVDALNNNDTKHHVNHDNKGICTINSSVLQHLYLGQNDITDIGIEYIAEMLRINRMLTWLWLSGNEIGNHGVELLSNTLANHNTNLEWLFLNSNKAIDDASIDALIRMLRRNHSLKTIYINNCNLSDMAKQRLIEITKMKKDFDLEV